MHRMDAAAGVHDSWSIVGVKHKMPKMPMSCRSSVLTRAHVQVAIGGLRPVFPPYTPEDYKHLAEGCWQADPAAR